MRDHPRSSHMSGPPHITICVCTYKRATMLTRLLSDLSRLTTDGQFTYSIVVVDNDRQESARAPTAQFQTTGPVSVSYVVEPEQNIARARNRATSHAAGEFLAFIDDDEFPPPEWLLIMLDALRRYKTDGILGPVKPAFDVVPPTWLIKGRFYDRESHPTGHVLAWQNCRTGNVLMKRSLIESDATPFNPNLGSGGEDRDLFRRLIAKGHTFVWCDEAAVFETVPPVRWQTKFMLRRALLRGKMATAQKGFGPRDLVKSALALLIYSALLPFLPVFGRHHFMQYLIRAFDHLGKILAVLGIDPVKETYVTG